MKIAKNEKKLARSAAICIWIIWIAGNMCLLWYLVDSLFVWLVGLFVMFTFWYSENHFHTNLLQEVNTIKRTLARPEWLVRLVRKTWGKIKHELPIFVLSITIVLIIWCGWWIFKVLGLPQLLRAFDESISKDQIKHISSYIGWLTLFWFMTIRTIRTKILTDLH